MRCANLTTHLADYVDGYADERSRRIVERHIELCQSCREAVVITHQLGQQLLRLPLLPLGVMERVPGIRRRLEQQIVRRRPALHPVLVSVLYVVVVIALYALLWLLITRLLALR